MAITKLVGNGRSNGYTTGVITISGTESAVVDLQGFCNYGLMIPAIDSADLTFKASNLSDGTFYAVKDKTGSALTISSGTGSFAVESDDLTGLKGYRYVKIVSSTAQNSAAVTFTFTMKA